MKRLIQFNTISATKALIRKLSGQGIKLTRKAVDEEGKLLGSAFYRHDSTINVSKGMGELGGRRNVLWHEAGHAEGNAAGSMKEIDKMHSQLPDDAVYADPRHYKGAYKEAIQNEERLADTNAASAMQKAGVPQANINQYHQDRIAPRSTYGIKDNPSPVGNPSNPPGNPGTSQPTASQPAQPATPQPSKGSFGGALAVGGIAAAGLGIAAAAKKPKDDYEGQTFRAKLEAICFAANPLFREGIKPGAHRLGGVGVERKVRIRDIVSSQALVDEKKVRKLARFTKNMPGKATVSWNGKNWIAKDGNHRLNAMLKQGKRKAIVLVQKLSSQQPVIQFGMFIRNGRVYRDALISPHSILPTDAASFAELGHKRKKAMDYAARWAKGSTPPKISTGGIDADTGKIYATEGHHRTMAAKHLDKLVPSQISYSLSKKSEALSEERKAARKLLGFSSPSPLIQLASRWKAVLKSGTDKQKRELLSRRGMGLMERKPHLVDPATSGLKRSVTIPEFMRSIRDDVRVDRPYPDWANAIEKHPEISKHRPVEMLGLGSSALALKLKNGSVMKIQTRPFSDSKWDIQTSKIGEVEVPKHHKAPSGRLHIGIQPLADVQGVKNNYAGAKLLERRMKKEGYAPGEFKQENFGYVGGKLKYIDADGSQKLSAIQQPIQFMEDTADPTPIGIGRRIIPKRRPIKPRNPIQQLSADLDTIMLATGRSEKYLAGTMWSKDVDVRDDSGRVKKKPGLAKEYYQAAIQQKEPRSTSLKKNRGEPDWVGERGVDRRQNPDLFRKVSDSPVKSQYDASHQYVDEGPVRKDPATGRTVGGGSKSEPVRYTRRTIDAPSTVPRTKGKTGLRNIEPDDLLNTKGYRALKLKQLAHDDASKVRQGYSEADLIAHDVPERKRALLRQGTDITSDAKTRGQIRSDSRAIRKALVSGDIKPEMTNVRTKIARDADINRRLVHAIRKESGNSGFFRKPDDKVVAINKSATKDAMKQQSGLLSAVRANFDTHLAGETERRRAQAGKIYDMVRTKAHEKLVEQEHGPDWATKLTGRHRAAAFAKHESKAQNYAQSIKSPSPASHDDLAALIGAKPEGLAKVRENYNSLMNEDYATHRKIQNRIIRSGRVFDGTPAFTPPEPVAVAKKGFPTLKKIGIAGAALGAGALAYHMLKKRREQEPQKQLMSSRQRLIQFGKKFPVKLPKNADSALTNLAHKLLNKAEGTAAKNEAKFAGGKIPGPEAPASQWQQIEAAQDISPEATGLVEGARKRIRKALAKPGGIKKMKPHDIVGDKMAEDLTPMTKGRIGNELKKLYGHGNPARPLRGSRAAFAQGRIESTPVERGDVAGVMAALETDSAEKAQRHIAVQRPIVARNIRADRAAKRGYIQKTGNDPDTVITGIRSDLLKAQGDKLAAEKNAALDIAEAHQQRQTEVKAIRSSSESAKQEALNSQAAGHKQVLDKARSTGWRNAAIGTAAGFAGGAAIAGNASRQTYEPKRKVLMSARGRPVQFDKPNYGEIAKDTAVGAGLSVAGTGALLYGAGKVLNKRMPDLSHMLNTASKQHINVFRPSKVIPTLKAIPEAGVLFGKQLAGLKSAEKLATSGKPTVKRVKSAIKKSGFTGQKDIDNLKAFNKQHGTTPGDVMEKSVGMLSGAASTLIGGAGGAAMSHGWNPKKENQYSSRARLIRFDDPRMIQKKPTAAHDIVTGGIEGGLGVLATDRLIKKFAPKGSALWRKLAIGAGVGALATGLIGAGVNAVSKKKTQEFSSPSIRFGTIPSRSVVTQDRYRKGVYDKDEERASKNYERSALAGGGLSVLLRGKKTRVGTFIAGAGAGIGAQLATRALTSTSKDQFGDRSHLGKRIDKLPWQVPALIAGGIIGKRAYKAGALKMASKTKLIQFYSEDDMDAAIRSQKDDDRMWRKSRTQVSKITQGAKRGTRLTQDLIRAAKGQKNLDSRGRERKREWDKPWVRNAITGTIAAGTLYGFHKTIKSTGPGSALGRAKEMYHQGKFHNYAREKIPGFKKVHDWVRGFKGDAIGEAGQAVEKGGFLHRALDRVEAVGGKAAPHIKNADGSITIIPHGTTAAAAHKKATIPEPDKVAAAASAQEERDMLSSLKKTQKGDLFHSAKGPVIRFAAEDWEERTHGDLLHVAKIRRRNRREKNTLERKDWQDSVVVPAKLGAAVLTGALGARLLGPRIIAGANAARTASRVRKTTDLRPMMQNAVNAHSLDPFITLSAKLDRHLKSGEKDQSAARTAARTAGLAAGAGLIAIGSSFAPAAAALARTPARNIVRKIRGKFGEVKKDPNAGGRFVADYLDSAQASLNKGIQGKISGAMISHVDKNPSGKLSRFLGNTNPEEAKLSVEHYGGFRAGHRKALRLWDNEHAYSVEQKAADRPDEWLIGRLSAMHQRRTAAHREINAAMRKHVMNESEAIRHVATTSKNQHTQDYFSSLAAHKAEAGSGYTKYGLIAPASLASGGALVAASTGSERDPREKKRKVIANHSRDPFITLNAILDRAIQFDEDHHPISGAAAGLVIGGTKGTKVGSRKIRKGESLEGKIVFRQHRHPILGALGLQHDGIGTADGRIAQVHSPDAFGTGTVQSVTPKEFAKGKDIRVMKGRRNPAAAQAAASQIGSKSSYNIFTKNCQTFTKNATGRKLPRQLKPALIGAALGEVAGQMLSSKSAPIEFGFRVFKDAAELKRLGYSIEKHPSLFKNAEKMGGKIAKWGEDLPTKFPDGMKGNKLTSTSGIMQIEDPANAGLSVTIQRSVGRNPTGNDTGWWKKKNAYLANMNMPKESRGTVAGGRSLTEVFGGTKINDAGAKEHTGLLGHFDKRGITARATAGAYENRSAAKRQVETAALTKLYQKAGFKIQNRPGNTPNEWNVDVVRSPGAKRIKNPVNEESYGNYIQGARDAAISKHFGKLKGHLGNIAPSRGTIAGAAAIGGTAIAAQGDSERSQTAKKALIPIAALGSMAAGRKLIKTGSYLRTNAKKIGESVRQIAVLGRINVGRKLSGSSSKIARSLGKRVLREYA